MAAIVDASEWVNSPSSSEALAPRAFGGRTVQRVVRWKLFWRQRTPRRPWWRARPDSRGFGAGMVPRWWRPTSAPISVTREEDLVEGIRVVQSSNAKMIRIARSSAKAIPHRVRMLLRPFAVGLSQRLSFNPTVFAIARISGLEAKENSRITQTKVSAIATLQ